MNKVKQIPPDIDECMNYLAYSFNNTMRYSYMDKEDLKNDLVVLYLEKLIPGDSKQTKNYWFICFQNYLKNKYKNYKLENKLFNKYYEINKELNNEE